MSRFLLAHFTMLILAANLFAQSLAPSAPGNSPIASKSTAVSSPSPSVTPTGTDLINSLGAADLQAAIALLKSNFTNPDAITETELNRATVQGLMTRLPNGVKLLPNRESTPTDALTPLYSEILDGHIGYLRLGSLNSANLQAMDKSLSNFTGKKMDALVVDLRASSGTNDFVVVAEFAKRFCPKGKPLFTLRRVYDKALLAGQPSAGRAAEYSDLALPGGKILRVAVAEMVSPEGHSLFPDGVKPDLPVEMSVADKLQIFQLSGEKGMGPFVYQAGRPHMNEAALLAGTNPELEAVEAAQQRRGRAPEKPPAHDPVLQRALDVVTSLEIYQKR